MLRLLSRSLPRPHPPSFFLTRAMSSVPHFKPFNLALIQLGHLGKDKDGLSLPTLDFQLLHQPPYRSL